MSDPAQVSPRSSPRAISLQKILRKFPIAIRRATVVLLTCCAIAQIALADSVTYKQLQQGQEGRSRATAVSPAVVRTQSQDRQGQNQSAQSGQSQSEQSQSGATAQESPNHPEFVRLPDGRIVRYGPGILCDENCVEPVTPAAFREPGPRIWWLVPSLVSGGVLCAFLCRGGDESQPQPTPTIIIPPPTPVVTPTVIPSPQPTPEVPEVPEPGTLILFGLGISTMLARRRMAAKKEKSD
ncbi:MAG: PEP-CTERM sorting domain-containing protein [Blastocatellales bacterium]